MSCCNNLHCGKNLFDVSHSKKLELFFLKNFFKCLAFIVCSDKYFD